MRGVPKNRVFLFKYVRFGCKKKSEGIALDECPSHDSSKTIMSFSKENHGHGLDEICVEGNRCDLRPQVPFKAIHCKLRSMCLALPSWWVFVHCFLVKLNPTRIIVRELLLECSSRIIKKIRTAFFGLVKKSVKTPKTSFLPGPEKSSYFTGPAACGPARGRDWGDKCFIPDSKNSSCPKK